MWTPQLHHVDSQSANLILELLLAASGTKVPSAAILNVALLALSARAHVLGNSRQDFALEIYDLLQVFEMLPAEAWPDEGMESTQKLVRSR